MHGIVIIFIVLEVDGQERGSWFQHHQKCIGASSFLWFSTKKLVELAVLLLFPPPFFLYSLKHFLWKKYQELFSLVSIDVYNNNDPIVNCYFVK